MSANERLGKLTQHEYIRELEKQVAKCKHIESLPLDGTANTEYCDCDKIERSCWWYLPVSLGLIVLSYAIGVVTAICLIN